MKRNISKILQDLYTIDASLRQHEKELIKLIDKLLVSRPDTKFNKAFTRRLRKQLLNSKQATKSNYIPLFINNFQDMFTTKKFTYAGASALIIILAIVSVSYLNQNNKSSIITQVGDHAFGSLVGQGNDAQPLAVDEAVGIGGGGGGGLSFEASARDGIAVDSKMIMPNPYAVKYNYIYAGDEIVVEEEELAVLKKIKDLQIATKLAGKFSNINFGSVDLGKFSNLAIQNISLIEDKEYGYSININPQEGNISINKNWQKWPNPNDKCRERKCFEDLRLKPADVPADEVLIEIANSFIKEKGIDISNYGEPKVNRDWLRTFELTKKELVYAPESVTVNYPLIIDDKIAYEEGGQSVNMNINIDIREKKVSGLWGYQIQNYESSLYEAETNASRIQKIAEQGGRYPRNWYGESKEVKDLKLGTPQMAYVRIWHYNNNKNSELFVPAFVFPIIEGQDDLPSYMQNVTVPLVKELLDEIKEDDRGKPLPEPIPMPLEEPVSSGDDDGDKQICEDKCGDDECQEVVCEAEGCPCSETKDSCPGDCE